MATLVAKNEVTWIEVSEKKDTTSHSSYDLGKYFVLELIVSVGYLRAYYMQHDVCFVNCSPISSKADAKAGQVWGCRPLFLRKIISLRELWLQKDDKMPTAKRLQNLSSRSLHTKTCLHPSFIYSLWQRAWCKQVFASLPADSENIQLKLNPVRLSPDYLLNLSQWDQTRYFCFLF